VRLALNCVPQRRSDSRGHLDRDEAILREQIVLFAFIDDAKITITLRLDIRQDGVDLVAL
jgi:hypothetical protein